MSIHQFYIRPETVASQNPFIEGADAAHIRNVLRLGPGAELALFDGRGHEYTARIDRLAPGKVHLVDLLCSRTNPPPPVSVAMAQAILKDNKLDSAIRQLTELGMQEWMAFKTQRCVPKIDDRRFAGRVQRWQRIALEAAKQCGRVFLPEIGGTCPDFAAMLAKGADYDLKFIFWEKAGDPLRKMPVTGSGSLRILGLLGPEGGFTEQEANAALAHGFVPVSLGPRILRADTAAIAACCLLQYVFGDL